MKVNFISALLNKMRHYIHAILAILILIFAFTVSVNPQSGVKVIDYGNNKNAGNYISVNGAKQYVAFAANLTPDTMALYPSFYNEVLRDRKLADEMLLKKDTTQNWKVVQQRNRMMEFQPQISASDLHKIKCPVLVMSTDRDIVREEHTVYIYQNITKANLCILAGEGHYITKDNPDLFNQTVQKYLDGSYKGEEMRQ